MRTTSSRIRTAALAMAAGLVLAACDADPAAETPAAETPAAEAPTAEAPAEAAGTVVGTTQGEPGLFLADADGMSLYLFTNDTPGVSNCTGDCLAAWPALLTDGAPVAGDGVDAALLGTTTRDDGSVQVTYAGWPLYYFAGDAAPGALEGQGVNDVWYVVSPEGEMLGAEPVAEAPMGGGGYGSGSSMDGYDY